MKVKFSVCDPVWIIHPNKFIKWPAKIQSIKKTHPCIYSVRFYAWPILEQALFQFEERALTALDKQQMNEERCDVEMYECYRMAKNEVVRRRFAMMKQLNDGWERCADKDWGAFELNKLIDQLLYLQFDKQTKYLAIKKLRQFQCKRSEVNAYTILQLAPKITYLINQDQLQAEFENQLINIKQNIKQLIFQSLYQQTIRNK